MRPNLWMYSSEREQRTIAASLLVFGTEVFSQSKIIKDLDLLEKIIIDLDEGKNPSQQFQINEFIFSHLLDCISILIFFENYMKSQLIIKGYCVHRINKDIPIFKQISKLQYKEPISLSAINNISAFEVNEEQKEIYHFALKNQTIGIKELISSNKYLTNYNIEPEILKLIKELVIFRNSLHFHNSIEFSMSSEKIKLYKQLKIFVHNSSSWIRKSS